MEHTPPPFFKRGPAPVVRLTFFALLSMALIVLDARFRYADGLRSALTLVTQPVQMVALAPVAAARRVAAFFTSQAQLSGENAELRTKLLEATLAAQRLEAEAAEAARLKRLMGAAERVQGATAAPAEIVYNTRDPFARRVFVDKGSREGVVAGSPVIDERGVVGQVTRVHTLLSEVTLLTDKNQAIPVQIVRNGLRAVAFGGGASGQIELRYLALNAEVVNGDRLVTSGIDGVYPQGLAVGTVSRVERDATNTFARVFCEPAAGIERGRTVLVLTPAATVAAAPIPEEAAGDKGRERSSGKTRRQRAKEARGP